MADRDASFFGPVLPQNPIAPEAFSFDELQRIRANRIAADMQRHGPAGWPEHRRFRTMYPAAPGTRHAPASDRTPVWSRDQRS